MIAPVIGNVVQLQVQRSPLKNDAVYDPAALLEVDEIRIGAMGVIGRTECGWVLDTHHAAHPQVRGRGLRGVSMGFTSHYEAMQDRYASVPLGVAGENIIVATDRRWDATQLAGGVVIEGSDRDAVELPAAYPAAPCLEFTSFLLRLPERAARDDVIDELDFLDGGTRGFIVDAARLATPAAVRIGDQVRLL